jgi:antitoxin (DNA-binding transcriptional repressor) of toxin-antitoxin stability system
MKTFDTSELLKHIDEVLSMVEEEGETIEISNHGEVIAHLVPASGQQTLAKPTKRDVWADLERLATEISANWPSNISAVDAVRVVRREL